MTAAAEAPPTALRQAADWIVSSGYPFDWCTDEQPPADLWEAIVDAAHADPDGNLHGRSATREEVDAWMRVEAGRPDDDAPKGTS